MQMQDLFHVCSSWFQLRLRKGRVRSRWRSADRRCSCPGSSHLPYEVPLRGFCSFCEFLHGGRTCSVKWDVAVCEKMESRPSWAKGSTGASSPRGQRPADGAGAVSTQVCSRRGFGVTPSTCTEITVCVVTAGTRSPAPGMRGRCQCASLRHHHLRRELLRSRACVPTPQQLLHQRIKIHLGATVQGIRLEKCCAGKQKG